MQLNNFNAFYNIITELEILYEQSFLSFSDLSVSEDQLLKQIMEKSIRLFGIRYFALLMGIQNTRKLICSWGFRNENDIAEKIKQNNPNQFIYSFSIDNENALLFMEQAYPIKNRESHFYNFFAQHLKKVLLNLRNINKLKQKERALYNTFELLKNSEEYFHSIIQTANDAIILISFDGKILAWNYAAENIFQYTPDEIIDKEINVLIKDSFKLFYQNKIKEIDSVKQIIHKKFEIIGIKKDGNEIPLEFSLSSWKAKGQNFFTAIIRDISERKWAEEMLKNSVQRWSNTFDAISDAIFLINSDGKIFQCNKAMLELIGKSFEEIIDKPCYEVIHCSEKIENCPFNKLKKNLSKGSIVLSINKQWFNITLYPLLNDSGNFIGCIHVMNNITEARKAEEKLLAYHKQLRYLASELLLTEERERRSLAENLHDNIGQTLAIAKIKLSALKQIATPDDYVDSIHEIYKLVEQAIQETRSVISDLSPQILYELGIEAALEWLSEKIYEQYGLFVEIKNDGLHKELNDNSRVILFQAVKEVLINIVKHAKTDKAKLSLKKENTLMKVTIEDSGVGFDVSKFYSGFDKNKGFGLFNIRERLSYLGAKFDIKSDIGHGTIVNITIPLKYNKKNKLSCQNIGTMDSTSSPTKANENMVVLQLGENK